MVLKSSRFLFVAICLWTSGLLSAFGANAWHVADSQTIDKNAGVGSANLVHMRDPWIEISNNPASPTTITIYQGIQKWSNAGATQIANQTGGTLYYKGQSQPNWTGVNLSFHQNQQSQNNQYWKAQFSTAGIPANDPIQYYIFVSTDGVNYNGANQNQSGFVYAPAGQGDHSAAFINGVDSQADPGKATAAGNPFSVRNRPGWIFHADNRVVSGSDIQFWAKVGYVGDPNSLATRWADNGALYYTTDGTDPIIGGTPGSAGNASTHVATFTYDHPENTNQNGGNQSIAGTAMWWVATGPGLLSTPLGTTIKYKVGFWNSSNNEQKFGDYNAGDTTNYLGHVFTFGNGTIGDPTLMVNGTEANYTTTHVFVNELANDAIPLTILFSPNAANVVAVELVTNLNRRDRAALDGNGDGIEDGVVAPDANGLTAGDDTQYYKAYVMTATGNPGQYSLSNFAAQKTGAYRLSARYKVTGNPNWIWYTSNGRRDHCIVVSPKKSRDISLYELNTINIESQGTQDTQRSTFVDLWDGPGSRPYNAVTSRFNLGYLQNLGVNWLWFQPIHPQGVDGRQIDPDTNQPYEVGSPYAVKNFFEVMPLMSKANTRAAAMTEFADFVAAADAAGINVMLDAPFNHTAYDAELAASGVAYFNNAAAPTDEIRSKEARFYSRTDAYDMRASGSGNVAVAPDRYDFGKFGDTHDVYFGRYAALVPNSSQSGNYVNEGDWFDYSIGNENSAGSGNGHFDAVTQNVWRYFSDYILYWLDKTGCPAGTPSNLSYKGIDGLRADFGQGLPPQCWEYIINKARSRKWDFVFMTESLDGGAVTYRSNRHFDVLNENIVFSLKSAANTSDYRSIFDGRRSAYGQSLVLLNSTSHDEESMDDPFQSFIRFGVCSSVDGAPMIFYGQELGLSRTFGFDRYELNFGKQIPHFKKYNSLQPLFAPGNRNFGLDQLYPLYSAVNQARTFSPALRSSNRYYLNQTGSGNTQPSIFSVAKYETANTSPGRSDVVFAFVNLDRNNTQQGNFNVNVTQNNSNLFGISATRTYNAKNIAAYTGQVANRRDAWLWNGSAGFSGQSILQNGVFVSLNPVPGSDPAWTTNPYEAQYLKIYDISPPNTPFPGPQVSNVYSYSLGNQITFSWSADPNVNPSYMLTVTVNGGTPFTVTTTTTSYTYTGNFGDVVSVVIKATNPDSSAQSSNSSSSTVTLLDPNGDTDGDGMKNQAEDAAGTNPLNASSVFRITNVTTSAVTWSSVSGKTYQLKSSNSPGGPFTTAVGSPITATGATTTQSITPVSGVFYRVEIAP